MGRLHAAAGIALRARLLAAWGVFRGAFVVWVGPFTIFIVVGRRGDGPRPGAPVAGGRE